MLVRMARALALTEHAVWWPSTLYQTTTLDLRGKGGRVLVDPGISPWEIEEVSRATPTRSATSWSRMPTGIT